MEDSLNTRCEHLSFLMFCIGFQTKFFEILVFCSVKRLFCWVQCVLYATFYVTAIILCYTKNIYKICNCKPHPESKFPNEYISVTFIQIDQHLKKLFKKYKRVPILWNTVYWHDLLVCVNIQVLWKERCNMSRTLSAWLYLLHMLHW